MSRARATEDQTLRDPIPIPSVGALALGAILSIALVYLLMNPSIDLAKKIVYSVLSLGILMGLAIGDLEISRMEIKK